MVHILTIVGLKWISFGWSKEPGMCLVPPVSSSVYSITVVPAAPAFGRASDRGRSADSQKGDLRSVSFTTWTCASCRRVDVRTRWVPLPRSSPGMSVLLGLLSDAACHTDGVASAIRENKETRLYVFAFDGCQVRHGTHGLRSRKSYNPF